MITKGHCLCGSVRWEYSGSQTWACHCHCVDCRRNCAAPIVSFIGVPLGRFTWTGATPKAYQSSPGVQRHFCDACGTPMAFQADHYVGEIHIYAASLEHPETFKPEFHVHYGTKLPWLHLDDTLPKYPHSKTAFPLRSIPANQTLAFRQEILWPDKPLSHVMVEGDDSALHIGAFDGETLIGIGSFYPQGTKAQLRKLAVDPSYRKMGIGRDIIQHGAQMMQNQGIGFLWCDARKTAIPFYQKLGFKIEPDVFYKSGIAYVKAQLCLS